MTASTSSAATEATITASVPSAIQATGIQKIFDTGKIRVHALRGVDFTVAPGEMVAIMGASGSGKTTLLNVLSGLDALTEGLVLIDGTDLSTLSDNDRTDYRAKNMGFIFQTFNLLPVLSAVENVELPLVVSGTRQKEARQKAMAMLERVGLTDWADHKPAELSGGQQQRVTVARALVNEPAIVWADEPTGSLDSENADQIMDLIVDLNHTNHQTFVIVTHDRRVAEMTDRIIQMKDGVCVSDHTTSNGPIERV